MKNTLRYLLIAVILSTASLLSVANATAQSLAQLPDNEMRSTSVLPASGSNLPQAAVEGITTTEDESGNPNKVGPHKASRPGDWDNPYDNPIGDAALPLMIMALIYGAIMLARKRRV